MHFVLLLGTCHVDARFCHDPTFRWISELLLAYHIRAMERSAAGDKVLV